MRLFQYLPTPFIIFIWGIASSKTNEAKPQYGMIVLPGEFACTQSKMGFKNLFLNSCAKRGGLTPLPATARKKNGKTVKVTAFSGRSHALAKNTLSYFVFTSPIIFNTPTCPLSMLLVLV